MFLLSLLSGFIGNIGTLFNVFIAPLKVIWWILSFIGKMILKQNKAKTRHQTHNKRKRK